VLPGCRGLDPVALFDLWRGSSAGGWDPHQHNFSPNTIVIGAQTLHAVGYAMGVVRDGAVGTGDADRDTGVLVCLGDGAMSQGDVSEALWWAAAQNLPVVFFCQNKPVGDQRARAGAEPGTVVSPIGWLRVSRRAHRRQRCAGIAGGHAQGA
jgi:TPP-dependent pyruvate/acetoin dehydrogenase alpha subunit